MLVLMIFKGEENLLLTTELLEMHAVSHVMWEIPTIMQHKKLEMKALLYARILTVVPFFIMGLLLYAVFHVLLELLLDDNGRGFFMVCVRLRAIMRTTIYLHGLLVQNNNTVDILQLLL